MEAKICFSGKNEEKFPSDGNMRKKYLMLGMAMKLPGGTIRKLAKTEKGCVIW